MQWTRFDDETERSAVPGGWFVRVKGATPFFYPDATKAWILPGVTQPNTTAPTPPVIPTSPITVRSLKVSGTRLIDTNGNTFTLKGINHSVSFGHQDNNLKAIQEIAKTGANCIRLAFLPSLGFDTPTEIRLVINECLRVKLVPILGCWSATGKEDEASLTACVDFWLKSADVLKEYSEKIILNIANEWGGFDADVWLKAYITAVKRVRDAGVTCPIMVDAGGAYGQNPRSIRDRGTALLASDTLKNIVFDVHMYAYWRTKDAKGVGDVGKWNDQGSQSPWLVADELKAIQAKGLCVVVGEIATETFADTGYVAKTALADLASLGIGWIAWSWNQNGRPGLDLTVSSAAYVFNKPADLSPAGQFFVLDPTYGIKATVKLATSF